MSDFSALNVAYTGLAAAQVGIETTSHNIANANTEGYSRQRVDLQTRFPFLSAYGPLGSGVEVAGVNRVRNAFLDDRVRAASEQAGQLQERSGLLERTEAVMNEPDLGITHALGDVWSAFEDVALNPSDSAARLDALARLRNLTGRVQGIRQGWDGLQDDAADRVRVHVDEANQLLEEIGRLNTQIQETNAFSGAPNDLLDRRDLLIDSLSRTIGARAEIQSNGTVRVALGGIGLVDGARAQTLSYAGPPTHGLTAGTTPVTAGGDLAGTITWLTTDLPAFTARLDQFATDLAAAFNAQQAAGETAPATPGGPILSFNPANPAGSLAVVITDPAQLAVSGSPYAPHSGANAQAFADLRSSLAAGGGTLTLDASIRGFITDLGSLTRTQVRAAEAQDQLVGAAELARKGTSGVSIDEEMVQMIQYQHAYNAAARVMTTIDEMLDVLVNRLGVVGR
jgi:flagellar hook-associated protein 1 FlgK